MPFVMLNVIVQAFQGLKPVGGASRRDVKPLQQLLDIGCERVDIDAKNVGNGAQLIDDRCRMRLMPYRISADICAGCEERDLSTPVAARLIVLLTDVEVRKPTFATDTEFLV